MGGSFLRLAAGRSPPRAGDVTRASGGSARTDSHAKGRAPRGRAAQLLRVSRSPAASRRKERMRTKDAHGHEQHEAITNQARRAQSSGPPRPAQPASGGPPARGPKGARRAVLRRITAGHQELGVTETKS